MTVLNCGAVGTTSPPHVSQCCPQPSPDSDARKKAPQSMTIMLYAKTAQAYFANLESFNSVSILLHSNLSSRFVKNNTGNRKREELRKLETLNGNRTFFYLSLLLAKNFNGFGFINSRTNLCRRLRSLLSPDSHFIRG